MKKLLALFLIIGLASTNVIAQSSPSSVVYDELNNASLSNQIIQLTNERPAIVLTSKTFAAGATNDYIFESIPFKPPCSFDLSEYPGKVDYILPWDDVWSEVLSLDYGQDTTAPPFIFSFYGQDTLSQYVIGSNGVLSFNLSVASGEDFIPSNWCDFSAGITLPSVNPDFLNCIFAPYHDIYFMVPSNRGHLYYYIEGEYPSRKLIVSFYEVPLFGNISQFATHMLVLYETTNTIEFYLLNKPCCTSTNGGKATLGIQNQTGTQATFITNAAGESYNGTPWSANNEAWRIRPSADLSYSSKWYKRPVAGGDRIELNAIYDNIIASPDSLEGAQYYILETSIIRLDGDTIMVYDSCIVKPQLDLAISKYEIENNISVSLYPNPTENESKLEIQGLKSQADIIVYDLSGRLISTYKFNPNQNQITLDFTGFAKGVYSVIIRNKDLNITRKLIVR